MNISEKKQSSMIFVFALFCVHSCQVSASAFHKAQLKAEQPRQQKDDANAQRLKTLVTDLILNNQTYFAQDEQKITNEPIPVEISASLLQIMLIMGNLPLYVTISLQTDNDKTNKVLVSLLPKLKFILRSTMRQHLMTPEQFRRLRDRLEILMPGQLGL